MPYVPPAGILEKYADLLVNFALGDGAGIKPGDTVWLRLHESAKPLYVPLRDAILKAGGNPLIEYKADGIDAAGAYELSSDEQLSFFMDKYYKGMVDQADHLLAVLSHADKYELQGVDPRRVMLAKNALAPYMRWRREKEAQGRFHWTLALYGTPAMAADAGLSEEDYWGQIIRACYLDAPDPKEEWRRTVAEIERVRGRLNALAIDGLHLESEGTGLVIGIGPNRRWLGGGGKNIPSFEIFTSPDWRRTEGTMRFNQPLYFHGNKVEGIRLTFKGGHAVEIEAERGADFLRAMMATDGADRLGEFSLTDGRLSRITKPMGDTLYDENMGGPQGNTHMAIGNAYQETYPGDSASVSPEQWQAWGYNASPVHTDLISTERRTVTATLADGSRTVIYADGRFTV